MVPGGEKLKAKGTYRICERHLNLRIKLALQKELLFIFWAATSFWNFCDFDLSLLPDTATCLHPSPKPLSWGARAHAPGPPTIAWGLCCSHFKTGQIVRWLSCKKRFFSQHQPFWWETWYIKAEKSSNHAGNDFKNVNEPFKINSFEGNLATPFSQLKILC